jgi:GNAT superfamily N-acetyltransferase
MKRGIKDDKCHDCIRAFYEDGKILGVIATKMTHKCANLKWIVTIPDARGKGVFRALCEDAVSRAQEVKRLTQSLTHFRVSINAPALTAYQKVGFKTWGIQASDTYLSIGRLAGPSVNDLIWEWDYYTEKEVTKQGMGGCVKEYWKEPRGL